MSYVIPIVVGFILGWAIRSLKTDSGNVITGFGWNNTINQKNESKNH